MTPIHFYTDDPNDNRIRVLLVRPTNNDFVDVRVPSTLAGTPFMQAVQLA